MVSCGRSFDGRGKSRIFQLCQAAAFTASEPLSPRCHKKRMAHKKRLSFGHNVAFDALLQPKKQAQGAKKNRKLRSILAFLGWLGWFK